MSLAAAQIDRPVSTYTIEWHVDWTDRPLQPPCSCRHDPAMGFPVGTEIRRKKRGGNEILVRGSICLDCGEDVTGRMDLVDGLCAVMERHGHRYQAWLRLNALVRHREGDLRRDYEGRLAPIWLHSALGMSGREIHAALNARAAREAASAKAPRPRRARAPHVHVHEGAAR